MQSVDMATLRAALESGATVLDTRPAPSRALDAVPGATPVRLEDIQAGHLPAVAKDDEIYLICERGQVSELAGLYLEAAGFNRVFNLVGGLRAWRKVEGD